MYTKGTVFMKPAVVCSDLRLSVSIYFILFLFFANYIYNFTFFSFFYDTY